ncbi:MAG: hypothetical protein JKZ03_06170 [Flavobacteriaceae bacterium]|nr:hypothetical protein [Flavobacteriaceae bacterium]
MNLKTNLILTVTILAVIGTVYAFSGYGKVHKCESLLALGATCNACDLEHKVPAIAKSGFLFDENNLTISNLTIEDKSISFFNVALVCAAAPHMGCGSRSKPVLKSFENSPKVKEAWLNREGNTIAVVWEDDVEHNDKLNIINTVFSRHDQNIDEVSSEAYQSVLTSFESGENWLKGDDVNDLSKEEASIFAEKIMRKIKSETTLNALNEKNLNKKLAIHFMISFYPPRRMILWKH